mmetsp:Transcript_40654/g.59419  ORF Transcript_40654/g.59419 Transcript_40654/m.59419 type:complete len:121 (-) Transcript_40654:69-431(-)
MFLAYNLIILMQLYLVALCHTFGIFQARVIIIYVAINCKDLALSGVYSTNFEPYELLYQTFSHHALTSTMIFDAFPPRENYELLQTSLPHIIHDELHHFSLSFGNLLSTDHCFLPSNNSP